MFLKDFFSFIDKKYNNILEITVKIEQNILKNVLTIENSDSEMLFLIFRHIDIKNRKLSTPNFFSPSL